MNAGLGLLFAGLAALFTAVGSFLGIFFHRPGPRFMTLTMGFSAGVMIFVSFVELLQQGIVSVGFLWALVSFFAGFMIMFAVDVMIPHDYMAEHMAQDHKRSKKINLARTSLFIALGIGIHNFPEGLATFAGTMQSINLGLAIAIAIALHNIPEGLAVSIPVYSATKNAFKAFMWSFFSGITEFLGACIAALFLMPFLTAFVLGIVLAGVAGLMVFIAVDELLPVSRSYGREHLSIVGVMAGMLVMAGSLWLTSLIG